MRVMLVCELEVHRRFSWNCAIRAGISMGKEQKVALGQRLVHGSCGAFLAALAAMSIMFWVAEINWWVVGLCAVFGFVLAWFVGEEAIEFLASVFWWS
jgi:hypothetical protein